MALLPRLGSYSTYAPSPCHELPSLSETTTTHYLLHVHLHIDMTVLRRAPFTLRPAIRRAYHRTQPGKLTIGIRREDPERIWERRCPLTPDAVQELVEKDGVDVLVQPCERRVFTSSDFLKVRILLC